MYHINVEIKPIIIIIENGPPGAHIDTEMGHSVPERM